MKTFILTITFLGALFSASQNVEARPARDHYRHYRHWHPHHYYGYRHHDRGYWAYRNGAQIFIPFL